MSDAISAEMLEAIDAFPASRIRVVKSGVSGIDTGTTGRQWFYNRKGLAPALRRRQAKRRDQYRRAVASGMNIDQIASELKVRSSTVYQTLRRMNLKVRHNG